MKLTKQYCQNLNKFFLDNINQFIFFELRTSLFHKNLSFLSYFGEFERFVLKPHI